MRQGLITVGTEMAGAGTVSLDALGICRKGVRGVLAHLGILDGEARPRDLPRRSCASRAMMATCSRRPTACSSRSTRLGTMVRAGQAAGRIHKLADPGREPETVFYAADGMVYGRRQPGRVVVGNCCVTVAAPYEGAIA